MSSTDVSQRARLVCQVFYEKFKEFLRQLVEDNVIGAQESYIWLTKFQKSGLPMGICYQFLQQNLRLALLILKTWINQCRTAPWLSPVLGCTRKQWNIYCWSLWKNESKNLLLQWRRGLQEIFSKRVCQQNKYKCEWLPTVWTIEQLEWQIRQKIRASLR